ncbi:MAG: hypothetical protein BGP10_06720 [Rhodanobacter sp. 68-29]|uniref:DUF488 domain-containing protein n=1 Tax=Rhodanobacter sp. PCA2 TaxID=2006117 RepID=UPI00086B5A35|nr:hypothetical protein [Rhodanobacter sp. PCA2]ODU73397.1 MAG: hypothetical protein ABT17_12185 [Rhodanobacter sp. SCN 69-32]OJY57197.1 MAG: hypothetical protein BGP10_06720 [Rhodanobacter sp. 68-29]
MNAAAPATIWTIGHSTRTLEEFLALLAAFRIEAIADVRRFPGSRRQPQFARDALAQSLPAHDIAYQWIPELGGRRRARPDSPNTAWRNAAFRGYADHLASAEFAAGLAALLAFAARQRTAVMCAEAVWWRCHRAIIADVLKQRGIEVVHILDRQHGTLHPWTSAAHVENGELSYAAPQPPLL